MEINNILLVALDKRKQEVKKDITDIALKSDNIAVTIQNELLKITQLSFDEFFNKFFDYSILINDADWYDFFKPKNTMPLTELNKLFNEKL